MMIYILLIIFSLIQLRLLYNEHLSLMSYAPEQEELGWYKFHTYGTVLVYLSIVGLCFMQLRGGSSLDCEPVTPFVKPSGGGSCGGGKAMKTKNTWKFRKMRRKNFNKI